ncbi:hypothetical protein DSL72_006985 [Monilinia vaccinii-corymbosi]|uniref:RING-type domain-containing protein n=1 Tax=Monilinia vaccinii-corymbosi TaxID=61207 RepID=A0A8A3PLI2_9HELO|nr:hypothetical protein DSL72_006985 [Monilinia vaccinii-corymbosi]
MVSTSSGGLLIDLDALADLDEQTSELIIQLQLEDAESYTVNSKGKGRAGEVSSEALAFQLQRQEMEKVLLLLADKRMTRSIASAVQTDGRILTGTLSREDTVARDHQLSMEGGAPNGASVALPADAEQTQPLDDELLAKMKILYISDDDYGHEDEDLEIERETNAESSTWAATRNNPSRKPLASCVACQEVFNFVDVARVPGPCRHEYCRACLEQLFELSMADESLFPPRCCRDPISILSVRFFLKSDLCKATAHTGDCPNDAALQQVLDIARESGWQRCHSCWSIVELQHGCNHMSCRCGAQFCYVCGLTWKTCTCEQWDEHRLVLRANEIVNRRPEHRLLDRPYQTLDREPRSMSTNEAPNEDPQDDDDGLQRAEREALVAAAVLNLRENHECEHTRWRQISGAHRCEECHDYLKKYILECRQCQLRALQILNAKILYSSGGYQ